MKQFSRAKDVPASDFFQRMAITQHARLTELRCSSCSSFLGASIRPELLDFIQKSHSCKLPDQSMMFSRPNPIVF